MQSSSEVVLQQSDNDIDHDLTTHDVDDNQPQVHFVSMTVRCICNGIM